jgi:DNA-binding PadR family transcriptional regulator
MSLRHSVLGLLAIQPSTGYELTRRFDRTLRNAWHAGHSQIYPELAKLEAAGLVEVIGEGARRSRTWDVTAAGRAELRRWLVEGEPHRAQRNETAVRWFLISLLDPPERRVVLERELAYLEAEAAERRAAVAEGGIAPGRATFAPVLDLADRMDGVMTAWLRDQLAATDRAS